ncbi:MAG: MmgE/PrpD family protein [Candidatus Lambdaproteobacteria bacterium]|nr:MmgE/PrpD family protein [Candidatus Lambdaproteobacteria bacterium]
MHETQMLAQFVAETRYADLPARLVAECRLAVLDTIAAGYVGSALPWAQRVVELVRELGGTPEASAINQPWQVDLSRAALANGAMIGAFECEPLTGSHASGTVLPAALAVSEREHRDGKAFLAALALGFEVSARIQRTAVGLESTRGFHNPGTQGPFGAAAAVGHLYGFNAATLASAFGLAGSCSAGLLEFAWTGADTKRVHLGRASQLGLESALLARKGLHGPTTVLEGRYGYYNAFSEPTDLGKLVAGLGKTWQIQPPSHKAYATHVTHQAVVQAIQQLKGEHPFDPRAITRIAIRGTHRIMEDRHAVREPTTVMGGQYSLPFTVAVALTRDMSNPRVYDAEALADPLVRELARRVELIPDESMHEAPGVFPAEVQLEAGGKRHTVPTRPHKGSPRDPLTWDEACEKFRRYTQGLVGDGQAGRIIATVGELERLGDMAQLARLLAKA